MTRPFGAAPRGGPFVMMPRPGSRGVIRGVRWMAWLALLAARLTAAAEGPTEYPLRIGFSAKLFAGMNENDAKAAVKGWGRTFARERGVPVNPEPVVLSSLEATRALLREGAVDVVGLVLPEYAEARTAAKLDTLLVPTSTGGVTERYVVLARNEPGVKGLSDLAGKSLNVYGAARMGLAPAWLDLLLHEHGLKSATEFFGVRKEFAKISPSVLPVFFGKVDVCLALRSGFETMADLNPQLRTRLRVVAESREFLTLVMAMRADYRPPVRDDVIAALEALHTTPAGRQALTIFYSDRLIRTEAAALEPSLDLLSRHGRLGQESDLAGK